MDRIYKKLLVLCLALAFFSSSICEAKSVPVGGNRVWGLGQDYAGWAARSGPFRVGDSFVFSSGGQKLGKAAIAHNVVLMKDLDHYRRCDFSGSIPLASPAQVASGYKFTIKQKKPHYFACSIASGGHCQGGMKFAVTPR